MAQNESDDKPKVTVAEAIAGGKTAWAGGVQIEGSRDPYSDDPNPKK